MFTDFFTIKDIEIIDNKMVTKEEVSLKSGLKTGENIFRFNKGKISENIERIPYIKSVSILRVFPNKVKIYLKERQALCAVFYENKFIYVDDEEVIVSYMEDLDETNIPIITTSSELIGSVVLGSKVQIQPEWVKRNIFTILNLFKKEELLQYISEVSITGDNLLYLYTKGGSIIKVKNSDIVVEKLNLIRTYLSKKDDRMIIDLTHGGDPTYIPR